MTRSVFHRIAQATCLLVLLTGGAKAEGDALDLNVEISYELFKLDNGLTVIVHEDHKAPVVAVNICLLASNGRSKRSSTLQH